MAAWSASAALLPLLLSPSEHKVWLGSGPEAHRRSGCRSWLAALGELRSDVSSRALLLSILPGVLFVSDFRNVAPELRSRLQQSVERAPDAPSSPLSSDPALSLAARWGRKLANRLGDIALPDRAGRKRSRSKPFLLVVRSVSEGDRLQPAPPWSIASAEEPPKSIVLPALCSRGRRGARSWPLVGRVYAAGSNRPHAELSVTREPKSAELIVDSKVWAGCRYKKTVFAGEHRVLVRQVGLPSEEGGHQPARLRASRAEPEAHPPRATAGAPPVRARGAQSPRSSYGARPGD